MGLKGLWVEKHMKWHNSQHLFGYIPLIMRYVVKQSVKR